MHAFLVCALLYEHLLKVKQNTHVLTADGESGERERERGRGGGGGGGKREREGRGRDREREVGERERAKTFSARLDRYSVSPWEKR